MIIRVDSVKSVHPPLTNDSISPILTMRSRNSVHSIFYYMKKRYSIGSVIFLMGAAAVVSHMYTFVTLRDSCFSASYSSAFPGECYEK